MAYNGAGSFSIGSSNYPFSNHTTADATDVDSVLEELAAGLSLAVCRDGQSTISGDLSMNTHRIRGLLEGALQDDAATVLGTMTGAGPYINSAGGSANVITLDLDINPTVAITGLTYWFIAANTNTGATTFQAGTLLAPTAIKKCGSADLVAGDIQSGYLVGVQWQGSNWQLISGQYAQGTWTPSVGGTATYTTQSGIWVKTGRRVNISCNLLINTIGTGSTNSITGLPFTSTSTDQPLYVSDFSTLATSVVWIGARVNSSSTTVALRNLTAAGASATSSTLLGNGTLVTFGGSYFI